MFNTKKIWKKTTFALLAAALFAAPSVSFAQCWRPFGGLFGGGWRTANRCGWNVCGDAYGSAYAVGDCASYSGGWNGACASGVCSASTTNGSACASGACNVDAYRNADVAPRCGVCDAASCSTGVCAENACDVDTCDAEETKSETATESGETLEKSPVETPKAETAVEQTSESGETTTVVSPCGPASCDALEFSRQVDAELEGMGATEKALFDRLNEVRRWNGRRAVAFEKNALAGCRTHSLRMAKRGYCFHYDNGRYAEICAPGRTIDEAFASWFRSGGHMTVMLGPYRRAAASYAFDNRGFGFWTIRFAY